MTQAKWFKVCLLVLLALLIVVHLVRPRSIPGGNPGNTHDKPVIEKDGTEAVKIVIDPGHGGKDTGAQRKNVIESEITLDISKKLKAYLEDKSYTAVLTRDADISLYTLSDIKDTIQRRELNARTNIINTSGADLFLSIHVNSYPKYPDMSGSIVYYNPSVPQAGDLAGIIQKQLNFLETEGYKRDTHNTQEGDFYLLNNAEITGVLVETAFITNKNDREQLTHDAFREMLAHAIADGVENYLNQAKP